jgi:hypothetical protein
VVSVAGGFDVSTGRERRRPRSGCRSEASLRRMRGGDWYTVAGDQPCSVFHVVEPSNTVNEKERNAVKRREKAADAQEAAPILMYCKRRIQYIKKAPNDRK